MNSKGQVVKGMTWIGLAFKADGVGPANGTIFRPLYQKYIVEI